MKGDDNVDISAVAFKLRKFNDNILHLVNTELRKYGLTYPQLEMLHFLSQRKGENTAIKDIEKFMQLTHPTVLGIVARLCAKGYVKTEISAEDRRVRLVSLTDKTFDVKSCEKNIQKVVIGEIKQNFSKEELEKVLNSLSTLINMIQ